MNLNIAFIGYNTAQTHTYFEEFAAENRDQIFSYNRASGHIVLQDGTQIHRITDNPGKVMGFRFDQILVAKDRRTYIGEVQIRLLLKVYNRLTPQVPKLMQIITYDLDSEEGET